MKKTILLTLTFLLGLINQQNSFSQNNSDKEITLCKTWYVSEAFEIRKSGKKSDQTEQARGTEFIFKPDYNFDFNMKSENRSKIGVWEFITQDSLSLDLQNHKIIFYIQHFSNDSMYLIGKDDPNSSMHITFSSSYIAPLTIEDNYSEEITIEEDAIYDINDEPIETIDYIDEKTTTLSKEEINRLICKDWNLQKVSLKEGEEIEEVDETEAIIFTFKNDQTFKFTEEGETEDYGKWEVLDNLTLNLEVEKETINFKIITLSDDTLIISGKNKGVIMKMHFKTKNK